MIFVHELGHFVVARKNGIRASEFGFGFPPRIFGVQIMSGKKMEKTGEKVILESKITDVKIGSEEIIESQETRKVEEIDEEVPVKKWRIIWGNKDGDDENEIIDHEEAHRDQLAGSTIYSLNWIPLGGFVKIKGENGENKDDPDSFAGKKPWVRTKVLLAGVMMNFLLAWFLISIVFLIGAPSDIAKIVDKNIPSAPIKITEVSTGSPAEQIGIKTGDEIVNNQKNGVRFTGVDDFIAYINSNKGKDITLEIKRNQNILNFSVTPRIDIPANQGALGVSFDPSKISLISYKWYESIGYGFLATIFIIGQTFIAFGTLIMSLFSNNKAALNDVAGPIGIFILAKQTVEVGFVYVAFFTALISINLGIINVLPIPALDGGRVLFILIEKIKGKPVKQNIEQFFHTTFFILLLSLMALISVHEVIKYQIIQKITHIF